MRLLRGYKKWRGVGLIELVIYVALFAMLTIGAIDLITNAYAIMAKVRLQRIINTEGELAMQRMIREIRGAYDIDSSNSIFNADPGALRLKTYTDGAGISTTTADLRITNGLLHFTKATTSIDLTSSDVSISRLMFRTINATSTPKGVKIEFTLTATSSRFTITSPFYGSASLRGSY